MASHSNERLGLDENRRFPRPAEPQARLPVLTLSLRGKSQETNTVGTGGRMGLVGKINQDGPMCLS